VKVYITARKAEACDALADELSKTGECISIPGDISRLDEINRLGTEIERRERRLDILVNKPAQAGGRIFSRFPSPVGTKSWTSMSSRCSF
jgi:short-subunit dehydrogenase